MCRAPGCQFLLVRQKKKLRFGAMNISHKDAHSMRESRALVNLNTGMRLLCKES